MISIPKTYRRIPVFCVKNHMPNGTHLRIRDRHVSAKTSTRRIKISLGISRQLINAELIGFQKRPAQSRSAGKQKIFLKTHAAQSIAFVKFNLRMMKISGRGQIIKNRADSVFRIGKGRNKICYFNKTGGSSIRQTRAAGVKGSHGLMKIGRRWQHSGGRRT